MKSTLQIVHVPVADILIGAKRRKLSLPWVETLAESMGKIGLRSPIEVALDESGLHHLVFGGHRLAAAKQLGWLDVPAIVSSVEDTEKASDLKLREISENLLRRSLSVLDRAFDIAEWRKIYEATHEVAKRGRPKTVSAAVWEEERVQDFALNFSDAAQKLLDISRRTVFHHLKIASIGEDLRQRIALHAIADNQSELLALAAETPSWRQSAIADILLAEPPQVSTVTDAILLLDESPAPIKPERWQKLTSVFAALKERDQHRFFDANSAAIESWSEASKAK
jgi:ParB family transcriptional regulator, chromosome partitioning protein